GPRRARHGAHPVARRSPRLAGGPALHAAPLPRAARIRTRPTRPAVRRTRPAQQGTLAHARGLSRELGAQGRDGSGTSSHATVPVPAPRAAAQSAGRRSRRPRRTPLPAPRAAGAAPDASALTGRAAIAPRARRALT